MNLRAHFGAALQLVRKKKGLTQEDFSEVSSRTYLSTLERGLKSPTLEKIEQIAGLLTIHPVTLISLAYIKGDKTNAKVFCDQIYKELKSIDDERR